MSIDDFIDFDVYDEHLFDSRKMMRYGRFDILGKLNDIASFDFELSQDVIDFLQDADTSLGVKAVESIRNYTAAHDNRKYAIMRSHRIISIASSVKEFSAQGIRAVLDELDVFDKNYQDMPDQDTETLRHNGALTFIKYVNAASEGIRKNTGHEHFTEALHTLALTAISDATKVKPKTDPSQAFLDALSSGGLRSYAKSAIGRKISFQNLPTGLRKIFESAGKKELESYQALLDIFPSTIHLHPDNFTTLCEDYQHALKQYDDEVKNVQKKFNQLKSEKSKSPGILSLEERWEIEAAKKDHLGEGTIFGYISNWIGASASKERFLFFYDIYHKYGEEGVCRLGKPLLTALYKKCKDDPKLIEKVYQKIIPKIYEAIPESNKRAPRWMMQIHRSLSACKSKDLEKVVHDALSTTISEKVRKQKEKALRKKYMILVGQIKKGNPLSATEYVCGLYAGLLEAMQAYGGTKTAILQAMGPDLDAVNQAYTDSGLPPDMVIGLYNSGRNSREVIEIADRIDQKDKDIFEKMNLNGLHKVLFSMGNDVGSIEDTLCDIRKFKDTDYSVLITVHDALSAPLHFVAGLDDDQKNAIITLGKGGSSLMIQSAYPKHFVAYAELHSKLGEGKQRLFLSDKVNETLAKYEMLDADGRQKLCSMADPGEAGAILRVYGKADDEGYDKLKQDWKSFIGDRGPSFRSLETLLEKFTSKYMTLDEDMRKTLLFTINDAWLQDSNNIQGIMSQAPEELPHNADHFFTMWGFAGQGYSDTQTLNLADNKDVQQKYPQVEHAYKKVWITLLRESTDTKKFLDLPSVDFYLAAEAYEFALQSKKEEMFLKSFDDCVKKGTVNKWAKTIIEYFREHSKGAGHYRNLADQDRALTAV